MSSTGKSIRMNRFRYPKSRLGLIVPIDHGLTIGAVAGIESVSRIGAWIAHPAITGIIAHKGIVERLAARGLLGGAGVMVHLNGMSTLAPSADRKEMLTTVESAVRLGADGVSVQVNFDGKNDAHNLQLLGAVADTAGRYGLPLLTMLYDKVQSDSTDKRIARLRHLMRITIELGSDSIKIGAPESLADIPAILDSLSEDASIYFAGGPLGSDEDLHALTTAAIAHGAAGLCVGRNVFQRPDPSEALAKLGAMLKRPAKQVTVPFKLELLEHGIH